MALSTLLIEEAVAAALKEDLGHGHDATSDSIIPTDLETTAVLRAREDGVLAGIVPALSAFTILDPDFDINIHKQDGEKLTSGDDIATIQGPARTLLTSERVALNFLSHLSGIATLTAQYVEAVKGTNAQIVCTRKTLPGLRAFQKYAVTCGGGKNHRFGLDDAILIKDNHIAVAGSVSEAIKRAQDYAGHMVKIEVEVDTLDQLKEALEHKIDTVMLDNMGHNNLSEAVSVIDGRVLSEASGGVNLETVRSLAESGVDMISVGALTHSAPALDIGLDIDL
ncbi:MAG: carboxylating nicotinate-nucleotide diphosphorylase [Pseudomonadota bacterium]